MVHFTELKGNKVYDLKGNCLGRLADLVFLDGTKYAEITHLIYEDENKYRKKIPWAFVKEFMQDNKGNKKYVYAKLKKEVIKSLE